MMRKKHQGAYLNNTGSRKFCIACAQIVKIRIRSFPCTAISPFCERHGSLRLSPIPTFSCQRPFQCSRHSLSIFEFTHTEYPINGYMVIHEPSSNTVNNILMLGRLPRSMFKNVFYDPIYGVC